MTRENPNHYPISFLQCQQFTSVHVMQNPVCLSVSLKQSIHQGWSLLWIHKICSAGFTHNWTLINRCVTEGIAHFFPKVFLWDQTKITPSHSKADNGLPTPVISHTHTYCSRSTREVCVWSGGLICEGQGNKRQSGL